MGALAVEGEVVPREGQQTHGGLADAAPQAVEHHGQVQVVEDPPVCHAHLGSVHLLRGGADDEDGSLKMVPQVRQGESRQDGQGAVQVVPAAVADLRQGVVLRQDAHGGTLPVAQGGSKARGVAAEGVFHLEARRGQQVHHPAAGFVFLVRQFRVRRQVVAQLHRRRPASGDGCPQRLGRPCTQHPALLRRIIEGHLLCSVLRPRTRGESRNSACTNVAYASSVKKSSIDFILH